MSSPATASTSVADVTRQTTEAIVSVTAVDSPPYSSSAANNNAVTRSNELEPTRLDSHVLADDRFISTESDPDPSVNDRFISTETDPDPSVNTRRVPPPVAPRPPKHLIPQYKGGGSPTPAD